MTQVVYPNNFIGPHLLGSQTQQQYALADSLAQGNVNPPAGGTWKNGDYVMPNGNVTGGSNWNKNINVNKSNNNSSKSSTSSQTDALKNSISSGWDSYINSLNDQLGGLSNQRSSQEGIVNSQYNQGVNDLGLQLQQGNQSLDQNKTSAMNNQTSNLRDISSNIRNAFQAGNVYLGTRGAGDSSAGDQYSYALNKMGTQQRSDVMNNTANILADIDARGTNLKNIYDTEIKNLGEKKNQGIQQVAQWFAEAQNQIRNLQSQGKLQKSQDLNNLSKDLLNRAFAEIDKVNSGITQQQQALDQWASGVANDLTSAKSSLSSTSDVAYNMPQAQQINSAPVVDSNGNMSANYYGGGNYGSNEKNKNSLFGNFNNWS